MKPGLLIIAILLLCTPLAYALVTEDPTAISIQNCTVRDVNAGASAACGDIVSVTCNVTAIGTGDALVKSVQYELGNGVLLTPRCITPSKCSESGSNNALWSANYTVGAKDSGFTAVQLTRASAVSTSGLTCAGSAVTDTDCFVSFNTSSVVAGCTCASTTTIGPAQRDNTATVTVNPSAGCGDTTSSTSTQFADYCDPGWVSAVSVCGGVNRSILAAEQYENVKGTLVKTYSMSDGGRCCAATSQQAGHLWFNHNTGSDCDAPVDEAASLTCYLDAWTGYQRGDAATGASTSTTYGKEGYVTYTSSIQSLWQPLAADVDNDGAIEIVVGSSTALTVATKNAAVKNQIAVNVVAQPAIWGITTKSTVLGSENPVEYAPDAAVNGSLIVVPVLDGGTYYVKVYSADLLTEVYSKNMGAYVLSGVACDEGTCYWAAQSGTGIFGYALNMTTGAYDAGPFMLMHDSATSGGAYTGVWSVMMTTLSISPTHVPIFMRTPATPSERWLVWTQKEFNGISGYGASVLLTEKDGTPIRRFAVSGQHTVGQTNYSIQGPFIFNYADGGLYTTSEERYVSGNSSRMQLSLLRVEPTVANTDANAFISAATSKVLVTAVWDAQSTATTEGISNVAINDEGLPVFKTYTLKNSDALVQTVPSFSLPVLVSTMPVLNPFSVSPDLVSLSPNENSFVARLSPVKYEVWNYNLGTKASEVGSSVDGRTTVYAGGVDWAHEIYGEMSGAWDGYLTSNPACVGFMYFGDFGVPPRYMTSMVNGCPWGSSNSILPLVWKEQGSGTKILWGPGGGPTIYSLDGTMGASGWDAANITGEPVATSAAVFPLSSGLVAGQLLNHIGPLRLDDDRQLQTTPLSGANVYFSGNNARFEDGCRFNDNPARPRFVCSDGKKYKYSTLNGTYTTTTASCSADFVPLMYHSDRAILGYLDKTRNDASNKSIPGPELVYCDFSDELLPLIIRTGTYLPPSTWSSSVNATGNYTHWTIAAYYQREHVSNYSTFDKVMIYGKALTAGNKTFAQLTVADRVLSLYYFDMTTEQPIDSTATSSTRTNEMRYDVDTARMYTTRGVTSTFVQKAYQTMADVDGDGGYESIAGRSVDSLTSGVSRNLTFSAVKDSWTVPIDLNSDGAVDVMSVGPTDFLKTYISNPSVTALTSGPPQIRSLRCTVTPNSGVVNVQLIGSLSTPDDAQVVLDPGDGTGSYFPDLALNGMYQYAYGSSGNYTIKVQLFESQNVFDISEKTCDVSVVIPSSAVTSQKCSLGLEGEFSFSDDVAKHGWLYDGGTLAPNAGIVGVNSGRLLQHQVADCDKTVQTVEFKVSANDGDLRVLSGSSQIGGVSFDTTVKTIRDLNGRSTGKTVTKGQDVTIRIVVDRDKSTTYAYLGDGTLLSTMNLTGAVTGVMVRGPMTVDYVRVSQSGGTVISALNVTTEGTLPGDTTKLRSCAAMNLSESNVSSVRMSYPNVGAYCNSLTGKRCKLDDLVGIVRAAPSCSKEAYNYCVTVAMPAKTGSANIEASGSSVQGATACSMLLTGSSLWGGVVSPTASVFWTMFTGNATVFILVIVLVVLVVPLYIKGKGR